MSDDNALVLVFSRNAFYKKMHFLALGALALTWVAIILLAFLLSYIWKNPPQPLYFATDDVGKLIQNVPVNTPNMSPDDVKAWVKEAVESTLSYDYINYRSQLQNAEKYFTSYGWSNYMKALSASGNLRALTVRKQVVIGSVLGDMKILAQGILSGAYAWKFQMPVLVTYLMPPYDGSKGTQVPNAYSVTVIVSRQNVLESYKGMAIIQMLIEEAGAAAAQQVQSISNQPAN